MEIVNTIFELPVWVWILLGFGLLFVFGDRKLWEYEVKFARVTGIGRGEIEFESLKKRGTSIEVKLELEPIYRSKPVEIFLNGKLVFSIPADKNAGEIMRITEAIDLTEPQEGDEVVVKISNEQLFSGQLIPD